MNARSLSSILVMTFCVIARLSAAQDPESDLLGLYFDEAAGQTSAVTTAPYQQVTAYLILTGPSFADGLTAWECLVEARTGGPDAIINWTLRGQALNVAVPPAFLVGMGEPLPSETDVILAEARILIPDPGQGLVFFLHPFDPPSVLDPPGFGYPVYAPAFGHGPDGELLSAGWASGCEAVPVATINADGPGGNWHLSGFPADGDFGYVEVGEIAEINSTMTNRGDLAISGIMSITGEDFQYRHGGGYFTDSPSWFHLGPGEELDYEVRFAPGDSLIYNGQLVLQVCEESFAMDLTGGYVEGGCIVVPPMHDFGLLPVGGQATRVFTVHSGDGVLIIHPYIDNPGFTAIPWGSETFPMTIPPHEARYVGVVFQPLADGDYEAVMDLGPSACGDVLLLGQGSSTIPPECDQNITEHDFGNVATGLLVSKFVSITNTGGNILPVLLALEQDGTEFSMNREPGLYELEPDQELQVRVDFLPQANEAYSAVLMTGTVCSSVSFTGHGRDPVENYIVVQHLEMPTAAVGTTVQRAFTVNNTGETTIAGDFQITGDPGFVLMNPGPFSVPPLTQIHRFVNFTPQSNGPFTATVATGLPGEETVAVSGYGVPVLPDPDNRLELYFDSGWTTNRGYTTQNDELITGYLVLHDPSAAGGVAGWDLCLTIDGYAQVSNWNVTGSSGPGFPGECPSLALEAPLPQAADLLLATVDFLVPLPYQNLIFLRASSDGPVPDYPVYVDGDDGTTLIPMDTRQEYYLAVINLYQVDVRIPDPPQVAAQAGNISLSWSCLEDVEGYHVYRRSGQNPATRLTGSPVVCNGTGAVFSDPSSFPAGTLLFYSISAIVEGNETARSTEVEIVATGNLPGAPRLMPCYPNPFNPETRIPFTLDRPGHIRLTVYDLGGRLVRELASENLAAGRHERTWDGRDQLGRSVPSGAYYFRLQTSSGAFMQKATLLK